MTIDSSHDKLTYDDFLHFPDDGRRHELIDGEHFVTPSPRPRHQILLGRLHASIFNLLDEHALGQLLLAPMDVVFSETDVVEPDLLFIAAARAAIVTDTNVRGAPDLVVEVISPSSRRTDELIKRKLYDRWHVKEYWIVDPDVDAVKVYLRRSEGETFVRASELSCEQGDTLTTSLLAGWQLALAKLFAP